MNKLFLVINEDRFFLSHRKEIAIAAQKNGFDVTIVCKNTGETHKIKKLGLHVIDLKIDPTSKNIFHELKTFFFLYKLYKHEKPTIVHHVGLKNILWGSLAAKYAKIKGVVNAVSGLGIIFSQEKKSIFSKIILQDLRFSHHRKNLFVIFQNHEDESLFVRNKIITSNQIAFIKGSGVDLVQFPYIPEPPDDVIKIIFTARMIKEKGVLVLVEAANILREKYLNKIQFLLCGRLSNTPHSLTKEDLDELCDGNYIKWLGFRSDVKELLQNSHIMAFPSYYREGVPKSLIEATAIGRPIITTNSVGCKDTVKDGFNGFLIPIKDSQTLAEKLSILINNKNLRVQMGLNSREVAEQEFSIENVVSKHLEIYKQLIK